MKKGHNNFPIRHLFDEEVFPARQIFKKHIFGIVLKPAGMPVMKYLAGFLFSIQGLLAFAQSGGELFHEGDMPMGNIAVSRVREEPLKIFFSLHPEGKPEGPRIFRIEEGMAVPFPDSAMQQDFISPLGIYLDKQDRLWVLDHANYALKTPRLYAFDASSGKLLISHPFSREVARKWVMLNDLTVTPDGRYVIMSAPGMFKKRSSIIVYDVDEDKAWRILTDHPTVMRKKFLPEVDGKKMRFILGLLKVRPGVDGIDMDPAGKYLYYAALADTMVYRVAVDAVTDYSLKDETLSGLIQSVGSRPLCDGIRLDRADFVYITDFQNHRILSMDPEGAVNVVLENKSIRWADGLSVGPDGYLYITDSALQHVILKNKKKFSKHKPFGIWRVKIAPGY